MGDVDGREGGSRWLGVRAVDVVLAFVTSGFGRVFWLLVCCILVTYK